MALGWAHSLAQWKDLNAVRPKLLEAKKAIEKANEQNFKTKEIDVQQETKQDVLTVRQLAEITGRTTMWVNQFVTKGSLVPCGTIKDEFHNKPTRVFDRTTALAFLESKKTEPRRIIDPTKPAPGRMMTTERLAQESGYSNAAISRFVSEGVIQSVGTGDAGTRLFDATETLARLKARAESNGLFAPRIKRRKQSSKPCPVVTHADSLVKQESKPTIRNVLVEAADKLQGLGAHREAYAMLRSLVME